MYSLSYEDSRSLKTSRILSFPKIDIQETSNFVDRFIKSRLEAISKQQLENLNAYITFNKLWGFHYSLFEIIKKYYLPSFHQNISHALLIYIAIKHIEKIDPSLKTEDNYFYSISRTNPKKIIFDQIKLNEFLEFKKSKCLSYYSKSQLIKINRTEDQPREIKSSKIINSAKQLFDVHRSNIGLDKLELDEDDYIIFLHNALCKSFYDYYRFDDDFKLKVFNTTPCEKEQLQIHTFLYQLLRPSLIKNLNYSLSSFLGSSNQVDDEIANFTEKNFIESNIDSTEYNQLKIELASKTFSKLLIVYDHFYYKMSKGQQKEEFEKNYKFFKIIKKQNNEIDIKFNVENLLKFSKFIFEQNKKFQPIVEVRAKKNLKPTIPIFTKRHRINLATRTLSDLYPYDSAGLITQDLNITTYMKTGSCNELSTINKKESLVRIRKSLKEQVLELCSKYISLNQEMIECCKEFGIYECKYNFKDEDISSEIEKHQKVINKYQEKISKIDEISYEEQINLRKEIQDHLEKKDIDDLNLEERIINFILILQIIRSSQMTRTPTTSTQTLSKLKTIPEKFTVNYQ